MVLLTYFRLQPVAGTDSLFSFGPSMVDHHLGEPCLGMDDWNTDGLG
jgi:hypothetical protein